MYTEEPGIIYTCTMAGTLSVDEIRRKKGRRWQEIALPLFVPGMIPAIVRAISCAVFGSTTCASTRLAVVVKSVQKAFFVCPFFAKRVLTKNYYPPDKQPKTVATNLEQAEILCAEISS